ncbi:hypothetical protein BDR03DRAFT_736394 [Suillus americanus]|nr:hypothetical protein BDR03DRAFT_736394 [Suillus americanus]
MTVVSDDPTWWPFISSSALVNYFVAASSTVVVYDWALTFGQEFDLVLRKRWSFMTVLYICVRYIGILFSAYVCKVIYITLQCANKPFLAASTSCVCILKCVCSF